MFVIVSLFAALPRSLTQGQGVGVYVVPRLDHWFNGGVFVCVCMNIDIYVRSNIYFAVQAAPRGPPKKKRPPRAKNKNLPHDAGICIKG